MPKNIFIYLVGFDGAKHLFIATQNFTDHNMYVLSKNPNWKTDNSSVVVLSDYTEFIKKYQNNLH
ncbi:hypothetical protein ACW95P_02295 [Candidatus Mycoplasma pogonae]